MPHHRDLSELELPASSLTIGSYDGVHRGHRQLIHRMVDSAAGKGWPAVVLTFFPHPSVVLRKREPAFYITTPEEKAALLSELGVEHVITHQFDLEFSRTEAGDFLDRLQEQLGFRELWAGEDFALGHDRRGDRHFLQREAELRGFELHLVEPFLLDGEVVSATRLRETLRSGDVARAARYLGRPFAMTGAVVRGAGRGAQLGIPTANLAVWEERAYPGGGVYACRAQVLGQTWPAVVNIGTRPTFEDDRARPVVEAHLLDFQPRNGQTELYDQEIRLEFVERLRDERRFDGPEALLKQIARDIRRARRLLGVEQKESSGK